MTITSSALRVGSAQIGQDAAVSKNFYIAAPGDGSLRINRGLPGAAISTPVTVDPQNNVWFANRIGAGADAVEDSDIPRWGQFKAKFLPTGHMHSSGSLVMDNVGTDGNGYYNYIYPPYGRTISDLRNVIVSMREVYYAGNVDSNDSEYCYYEVEWANNRIKVISFSNERRQSGSVNWRAEWNINYVL